MNILYEDALCLVCVKPVGVLSQRGKRDGAEDMIALLQAEHRGSMGGYYLIHRLDQEVGGVMLFAKEHAAAESLATAFENRQVQKEYLAVLRGVPEKAGETLRDFLFRDAESRLTKVVDRAHKGAKEAVLDYRVLESVERGGERLTLALVRLHTGRTHQIRVQFAARHLPLLGDKRYGIETEETAHPALWAYRLTFPRPRGKGTQTVSALPTGEPWSWFSPAALEN